MILVTGGTGFIGSHLVERLLEQGRKVRVLVLKTPFEAIEKDNESLLRSKGAKIYYGDLLDKKSLREAVEGVDTVFHLGGISRPMNIVTRRYYDTNVLGTKNLLEVLKRKKLKRFIHVSSVSVLGVSPDGHPLREDEIQPESLHYGLSKREGEHVALSYYHKHKVPVVVMRPSLVYGPRCLVRLIMFKFIKLRLFPIFNKGKAKMEFAYVDNVVEALMLAESAKGVLGEVFNITDGEAYEIGKVVKTIARELGARPSFIRIPVFLGVFFGVMSEVVSKGVGIFPPFSRTAADWMSSDVNVYDCTKAKKVLKYKPKVDLRTGVKRSIEWYKAQGVL